MTTWSPCLPGIPGRRDKGTRASRSLSVIFIVAGVPVLLPLHLPIFGYPILYPIFPHCYLSELLRKFLFFSCPFSRVCKKGESIEKNCLQKEMEGEQLLGARSTVYYKLIHEKGIEWDPESIYIVQYGLEERGFERRFPFGYNLSPANVLRKPQEKIQIPFVCFSPALGWTHALW